MANPMKHTGQPKLSRLAAASRHYLATKLDRELARLPGPQWPIAYGC